MSELEEVQGVDTGDIKGCTGVVRVQGDMFTPPEGEEGDLRGQQVTACSIRRLNTTTVENMKVCFKYVSLGIFKI